MRFNPNLHGLRGLAALSVFLFHWVALMPNVSSLLRGTIGPFHYNLGVPLGFGWLGVTVFFILSGYLLAARLRLAALDAAQVRAYLAHRVFRIVPAFWGQLVVLLLAAWLGARWPALPDGATILANALLWTDMPPWRISPINGVWWTLPVEMMFYVLLPALIGLIGRVGMLLVLAGGVAVTFAWRHVIPVLLPAPSQADNLAILNALPGSLSLFLLGVGIAYLPTRCGRLIRGLSIAAGLAGLYLTCVLLLGNLGTYWQGGRLLTTWSTLNGAAIAIAMYGLVVEGGAIAVLACRPMQWLGDLSYGIYLWHVPVLKTLLAYAPAAAWAPSNVLLGLLLATLTTLALAIASYRFIELPAIHLAARTFPGRHRALEPAPG